MKKWRLFSSIFQLIIGICALVMAIILLANGENVTKWIVTVLLSVAFVALGIVGIIEYRSDK